MGKEFQKAVDKSGSKTETKNLSRRYEGGLR